VSNNATSNASNASSTNQAANATQVGGSSTCFSGCGGNGQSQNVLQAALTHQSANSNAKAKQNAVNANVPVTVAGLGVLGGSSSANQAASNNATSNASNSSSTSQSAVPTQIGGSSSCFSGCGGNGQEQNVIQIGLTKQHADSDAKAKQNAVNTNAPVLVVGGDPSLGSSSANQEASNNATSNASNSSSTSQSAVPTQIAGSSICPFGCGGNGQEQNVLQIGVTKQHGHSQARARQGVIEF
jgi:hypothetical protein